MRRIYSILNFTGNQWMEAKTGEMWSFSLVQDAPDFGNITQNLFKIWLERQILFKINQGFSKSYWDPS